METFLFFFTQFEPITYKISGIPQAGLHYISLKNPQHSEIQYYHITPSVWHRRPLLPVLGQGRGVQGFLGYASSVFSAGCTSVYEAVCVRLASHSWLERNHTSLQLQSHHGTPLQITRITSYSWQEIWHHKPSSRDQPSKVCTHWHLKGKIVMKIGYGITYGVWQLFQKHAILISYESYLIWNAEMFKF